MTSTFQIVVVEHNDTYRHDAELLREVSERLQEPKVRQAVQTLLDGLSGHGMAMTEIEGAVTPAEAAELLGVSRQYVDKLITSGKLEATRKPGSTHRQIDVAELRAFTEHRKDRHADIGLTISGLVDAGAEY